MKIGVSLSAGLMALIVLVVLLLHQSCSAKDTNRDCVPSSCGNIPKISSPFRLENHPPNCGDPRYTLSCQDNQVVLFLLSVEYYVLAINYNNQTIRVVDSGIQKDNYSSIPSYYDLLYTPYNLDLLYTPYNFWEIRESMALLKCEKRVNSPRYLNKSSCFGRVYTSNSSSTQPEAGFRYVIYNHTKARDVEDLCQVEQIFWTSWRGPVNLPNDPSSISCADLQHLLLYGFELRWDKPHHPSPPPPPPPPGIQIVESAASSSLANNVIAAKDIREFLDCHFSTLWPTTNFVSRYSRWSKADSHRKAYR
ncbi:hypothetical protein I3843_05G226700 [Carya illinoinensis]|nr:hypothetical protein I3843_05G226700 [Carya illinoinensis]